MWNEFLFAVTFLPEPTLKPVATSLFEFQGRFSRDWGLTSAGSVIMVIPIIMLFLLLQRRFIEGLTQGGLKGNDGHHPWRFQQITSSASTPACWARSSASIWAARLRAGPTKRILENLGEI